MKEWEIKSLAEGLKNFSFWKKLYRNKELGYICFISFGTSSGFFQAAFKKKEKPCPYVKMYSALMPRPSARTKYFCLDKNFFPKLKKYIFACEMDGKWLFSHEKILSMAKKSFSIHFTTNMYLFSVRKIFLSGTKIFCPGRWTGHKSLYLVIR